MSQAESYLGGVVGGALHRTGYRAGYEIHATDKRIIGIRSPNIGGNILAIATGKIYDVQTVDPAAKDSKFIEELITKKDFTVARGELEELRIEYSRLFSNGYLLVKPKGEGSIKIRFGGGAARNMIADLVARFNQTR
jgi:hypothetical protein